MERVRQLPILALFTFRPEFEPPWVGLPNVSPLTVGRLEPSERFLHEVMGLDGKTVRLRTPDHAFDHSRQGTGGVHHVAFRTPDQEEQVTNKQERELLQKALTFLPVRERLLLQLRYEQDLSLDEIARLCELGDAQRVHRKLAAILKGLRRALR